MEEKSRRLTNRASVIAAVAAFIAQPIPAGDELIVVPIHYWLAKRIAKARGVDPKSLPWKSIRKIVWYGAAARLVANFSIGLVPIAGSLANSVTAIALTEFLGQWLDAYLETPHVPPAEVTMAGLKRIFTQALAKKKAGQEAAQAGQAA
jgi:uncharacterized protein (DUF697 family)